MYIADPSTARLSMELTGHEERFDHTARIVAHPRPEPSLPNRNRPHDDRRSKRAPEIYVEPEHKPVATLDLMGKRIALGAPSSTEWSEKKILLGIEASGLAISVGLLYGSGFHSLSLRAIYDTWLASSTSTQKAQVGLAGVAAASAIALLATLCSIFAKVTDQREKTRSSLS